MLRRILCAVGILGLTLTFAAAEEIKGTIVKVDDGKVTIRLKAKEKGKKGEEKTFDLGKTVKVCVKEGKETKEVSGGLKSDVITGLGKGKGGTIVTDTDNKVTEIIINAPGKKKKKDA